MVSHNTMIGNEEWGLDIHGNGTVEGDNYGPVVENNLLSGNECPWLLLDREIFDEPVDFNFYNCPAGTALGLFNWSGADRCFTLQQLQAHRGAADHQRTLQGVRQAGRPALRQCGEGRFSPAPGLAGKGCGRRRPGHGGASRPSLPAWGRTGNGAWPGCRTFGSCG